MKKTVFSNEYISVFCLQIALLLHAGIHLADGVHLMAEDDRDKECGAVLRSLAESLDEGKTLSGAMKEAGGFPAYVVHMTETGESTGRLEQAFHAMADYYDGRKQLQDRMKSALLYPMVLLILMLAVIGILLVKVLPVFHKVYEQLGGSMDGLAGGLLTAGYGLERGLPVIGIAAAVVLLVALAVFVHDGLRGGVVRFAKKVTGGWRIAKEIGDSGFAAALSMGMASGLPTEEALSLAASFHGDVPKTKERYVRCCTLIEEGQSLPEALRTTEILEPVYCRMLALGEKSGTADTVMGEIARRLEEKARNSIESLVNKVEPTIVIGASLMVGMILLAVMLPLMNIMSSIG